MRRRTQERTPGLREQAPPRGIDRIWRGWQNILLRSDFPPSPAGRSVLQGRRGRARHRRPPIHCEHRAPSRGRLPPFAKRRLLNRLPRIAEIACLPPARWRQLRVNLQHPMAGYPAWRDGRRSIGTHRAKLQRASRLLASSCLAPFQSHYLASNGKIPLTTRTTAGSISVPIIVGSMHTTSGIEISTGKRCAFSSARIRRRSRISDA